MSAAAIAISVVVQQSHDMQGDDFIAEAMEFESETSTHDDIAQLAFALWQQRGCPNGSAEIDWLEAELALWERDFVGWGPRYSR